MSHEPWIWQCDRLIPSDTVLGRQVLDEVLGEMEARQWCRRDVFGVHLAVDEALVNAILHGNQLDATKYVRFRCGISPHKIWVEITDEGEGFVLDSVPNPTDRAHLERPNGRGVMLMKAFMSHVDFNVRGNQVVLEKVREG